MLVKDCFACNKTEYSMLYSIGFVGQDRGNGPIAWPVISYPALRGYLFAFRST